jgi:hypothetical protein
MTHPQTGGGQSDSDGAALLDGTAWRDFCARMSALGDLLLDPSFPGSDRDRAEGYRHLANQLGGWLDHAVGSTDPRHPLLFRHNDLVMRWGGPNVDQNARRATIDGSGTYRLTGILHSCEDFVLQVKGGEMHTGGSVIVGEITGSDIGAGPGERLEILLSPEPQDGHWLKTDERVDTVHLREYYFDWQAAEPATFVIERLDTLDEPTVPLTPARVAGMLERAASTIEQSIVYWRDYQEMLRAEGTLNAFSEPAAVAEGVQGLHYAHAFVRLAPNEALVCEVDPRQARAWDVQLYNRAWYESIDFPHRQTSLNHRLAAPSADGLVRFVISATDPGVPNWLDTEGREEVMSTSRWLHATTAPTISNTVVPFAQVRQALPQDTPRVTPEQRREQVRRRASHVAWRFHT